MSGIVELEDVWKKFPMNRDRPGFKEFLVRLPKFLKRNTNSHFWALKQLSLKIDQGDCLGVIGRNGAGKSTLLSLMLGTILPSKGKVRVNQVVTPLLGLGAGFHPELTGRENILINGVLLGLTRDEVLEKMDEIMAFAEIGDFINVPVRTYSSGMYLRVAFSVAIHIDPKILLIDEVLGVGDASFQKKSRGALKELIKKGVTTILVSHSLNDIKDICNRVLWLEGGEVRAEGAPDEIVRQYMQSAS